jgi:hypothetical protein
MSLDGENGANPERREVIAPPYAMSEKLAAYVRRRTDPVELEADNCHQAE